MIPAIMTSDTSLSGSWSSFVVMYSTVVASQDQSVPSLAAETDVDRRSLTISLRFMMSLTEIMPTSLPFSEITGNTSVLANRIIV